MTVKQLPPIQWFFGLKRRKKGNKHNTLVLASFLLFMPMIARADDTSSVLDVLNNFLDYLTGDVGKALAALAIVTIGFLCFVMGRIHKSYVISVVVGVGVIFGAHTLLGTLTG